MESSLNSLRNDYSDDDEPNEECVLLNNIKRVKSMHDRVTFLENHLGKLCNAFSDYGVKSAAIRDTNDGLAQIIAKFAFDEHFNTTAKLSLKVVAELIASIGDHRNAEVKRIEAKVIPTLASYGNICKYLKLDIKSTAASLDKESASRRNLERLAEKFEGIEDDKCRALIEMAEGEYEKICTQSMRLQHLVVEQMSKFELKRMQDIKESLLSFFKIEIAIHARSLELLTDAYKYVDCIDEKSDLNVIRAEFAFNDKNDKTVYDSTDGEVKTYSNLKPKNDDENTLIKNCRSDIEKRLEELLGLPKRPDKSSEKKGKIKEVTKSFSFGDTEESCSSSSLIVEASKKKDKKIAQKPDRDKNKKVKEDKRKVSFQLCDKNNDDDGESKSETESCSQSSISKSSCSEQILYCSKVTKSSKHPSKYSSQK